MDHGATGSLLVGAHRGAQSSINEAYVPRLGDIMIAVQLRHIKLWLPAKQAIGRLQLMSLRQLRAGLQEASAVPISRIMSADHAQSTFSYCGDVLGDM